MLAGYETTSVALTYCIYLLSKHPQVQQKLLQEVDEFKGQPSYEQLDQFPYAAAVLNEALRLFPPAPLFARVAQEDTQVKLKSDVPTPMKKHKKKKDYAFWRQLNEKPSVISGCPGRFSCA